MPVAVASGGGGSDFVGSGAGHAHGLVPDPGAVAGTTKFLREDASWQAPPAGGTPLATPTVSGTVKTDVLQADPLVYTKASDDTLLAGKAPTVHVHAGTDITTGLVAAARLAAHDIISAHSAAGLTIGNVIRAATATSFVFAQLAFADLGSKPTTLAGYGITDAAPIVHTHAATDIVSGVLAAARGGTAADLSAAAIGAVPYFSATGVQSALAAGTSGFVYTCKGGAAPAWNSLVTVRLTADNAPIAAAAPTTALQVANLTQAALINDEWDIEWILDIANSIAADVFVFNVTSTAGTLTGRYTVEGTTGVPGAGAGVVKLLQNPAGTLTTATANAPGATGTIGLVCTVTVRARVKLTVANATIQLLLRAGTNAAASSGTATVKAQSQMRATRVA